jgi:hypothetical protein
MFLKVETLVLFAYLKYPKKGLGGFVDAGLLVDVAILDYIVGAFNHRFYTIVDPYCV